MKFNLLKTMLVAVGMVVSTGSWAEVGDKATIVNQTFTGSPTLTSTDAYTWGEDVSGMLTANGLYMTNKSNAANNYEDRDFLTFTDVIGDDTHEVNVSYEVYCSKDKGQANTYYTISYFNNDGDFVFAVQESSGGWGYGCNVIYATADGKETVALPDGHMSKGGGSTVNLTVKFSGETAAIEIEGNTFAAYTKSAGIKAVKLSVTGENGYDRDMHVKNYKVETTEIEAIKIAGYTVNYVVGDVTVKTIEKSGTVGDAVTLTDEETAAFDSEDKTERYICLSNDAAGKTIAKDGSTVVTVTCRNAEKWTYTVTSSYNGNNLDWNTSGETWEDINVTVHYPRYQQYDNTLVGRKPNGNDLTATIVVTQDGYTEDLTYTSENINNLYLLSEAEDLGTELSESGTSYNDRISGGKIIYGAEGKLLSLPAGKYIFTLGAIGGDNKNHIVKYNVYAGEQHIIENGSCEGNKLTLIKSSEFTLLEETDITFTSSDASTDRGIDLVYVQKTGEATVAASVGSTGFATFCPTVGVSFAGITDVEAYKATTVAEGVVNLTKVETVAAGEGVLLRSVEGGAATADVTVDAAAVKAEDNIFVGVTETIDALASEADGKTNYILNDGEFYKANDQKVAAGKAYLAVDGTSEAKSLKIAFGGDTTGISEVNATKADGTYYSVSGVRVANPTKGLYIMNGKKVIVK